MKSSINFIAMMLFMHLTCFEFSACKKEVNFPLSEENSQLSKQEKNFDLENGTSGMKASGKKVYVSNISQLYSAVNDPANAGSQIELAQGSYILDANQPNGGRLELQLDMKLQGQPGHPEQVVIDASGLPASSFSLPLTIPPNSFPLTLRTGAIRTGRGSNAIEWMTLVGNSADMALSMIETDLVGTPITYLQVAHTIVKNARIGIDLRNHDEESKGRVIEADITDNEITGNVVSSSATGIAMQNSRRVQDAVIRARLSGNYIHGNRVGITAYNAVARQSRIEIESTSDLIEANGLGLSFWAGLNQDPSFIVSDNVLTFEGHATTIRNNNGSPAPDNSTIPGGVTVIGGQAATPPALLPGNIAGTVNNNTLNLKLWACRVEGNLAPNQINAFGARSLAPLSDLAGTHNVVNIELHGISKNASVGVVSSIPAEPAGTNKVNVDQ